MQFFDPLVSFDSVDPDELNQCLVAWGHKMGPVNRPTPGWSHGMRENGRLVAVTSTDLLMAPNVAGFSREQAVELSRVCAERRDLCRVVLRLWREFVFPALARERGYSWALSYQDAVLHSGNLYRFDGWQEVGRSHSGTDTRSGRKGRTKVIWGWPAPVPAVQKAAA